LELFIRIKIRILVIKTNNITQMDKIRVHMVHKTASVDVPRDGPANSMLGKSRNEVLLRNFPDFLQTNRVNLRSSTFRKSVFFLYSFSQ